MNATPVGKLSPQKPYCYFKGPSERQSLELFLGGKVLPWLIEFGAVYVNHKRVVDPAFNVDPEDVIRVHTNPKRYNLDKEKIRSQITFQNEHFLVVNKPSGLPVHPTLDNLYENLLCAFEFPVYVTHRLDVPTSGLVVVAKTKMYQAVFNKLLLERKVSKVYEAQVEKFVAPGEYIHYMQKTVTAPKSFSHSDNGGLECRLIVHSCDKKENNTFKLIIELLTGRTHQIRGQLALEGAPIIGDEMYGGQPAVLFGLKATTLSFKCPFSGEQKYDLHF